MCILNFRAKVKQITNGAKLAVASVARATPLFLPRPKIIYINVLHYSAPPELIYYVQHRLYAPIGAIVYLHFTT